VSRELIVVSDGSFAERWPENSVTPADIAAWLHAHPAEAVEIVRGSRVLRAWAVCEVNVEGYIGTAWQRAVLIENLYPREDEAALVRGPDEDGSLRSAADAALVAAGWSLA
jgi:hypothetical protein